MRNFILALLAVGSWCNLPAAAQTVRTSQAVVTRLDRRLCAVSFELTVAHLRTNQTVAVTPILEHDSNSLLLCPIAVMGHDQRIAEIRKYRSKRPWFAPIQDKDRKDNFVDIRIKTPPKVRYNVVAPYKPGRHALLSGRVIVAPVRAKSTPKTDSLSLSCRMVMPYQEWMTGAELKIITRAEHCGVPTKPIKGVLLSNCLPAIYPVYDTLQIESVESAIRSLDVRMPYLYPAEEYEFVMQDFDNLSPEEALVVRFPVDRAELDPSFDNNAEALERIQFVLEQIKADTNASLDRIVLAGKASPEGRKTYNKQLSTRRAEALCQYLEQRVAPDQFQTIGQGEDWAGLKRMVEQSDMVDKQAVLEILETYPEAEEREQALKRLNAGAAYDYIATNFFPALRNAGYILLFYRYRTPLFTQMAGQDVDKAQLEWAIDLINHQNYRGAIQILRRAKNTFQVDNLRGVCHMMLYEFERAEFYLKRSVAQGGDFAQENLRQIAANGWPEQSDAAQIAQAKARKYTQRNGASMRFSAPPAERNTKKRPRNKLR